MSEEQFLTNSDVEDEGEGDDLQQLGNGGIRKNLLDAFVDLAKTNSNIPNNGREFMKVYLRIRPLTEEEIEGSQNQRCMETDGDTAILLNAPKDSFASKNEKRGREVTHRFTFSHVFGPQTTQKGFFDNTSLDVVKDFMDGQNCLVFTYGVTNSGKTYTMQGIPKDGGILPRTLDVLFNSIQDKQYPRLNLKPRYFCEVLKISEKQEHMESALRNGLLMSLNKEHFDLNSFLQLEESNNDITKGSIGDESSLQASLKSQEGDITDNDDIICEDDDTSRVTDDTSISVDAQGPVKFSVWVSFAEVYNELIFDLLEPCPEGKGKKRVTLKLGDDKNGNPYIKGLREICVSSADEAYKILRVGKKNQRISSTKLNQSSSRSHCIFNIKVLRVVDVENPHVARVSRLSFVDLAGSERYTKTQSTGDRLKESGNINTSLMTLGKCLDCLRQNQMHPNHPQIIPFRESKLTRLFQGFFCGKGKASMIVNINQCAATFDETYHALKFSAIAKQVTTKVTKPTDMAPPVEEKSFRASFAFPTNSKVPKLSVAWEDGSLMTPVAGGHDVDDDEGKVTVYIQQLENLVREFQDQLIEEKKGKATLELKIREEVCTEMGEQLVAIETAYSERIQEEVNAVEEKCDRRIELLAKSVKKNRKRARIEREDENCELKTEQEKNKELTAEVKELESNLQSMKTAIDEDEMRFKQQEDVMVELQSALETSSKELEIAKIKIDKRDRMLKDKDVEIEELKRKLDDLTEEAKLKTENQERLQQKLQEEARTKTSSLEILSEVVNKLESNLSEQQQLLNEKSQALEESCEKISRLENEKVLLVNDKEAWLVESDVRNKSLEEKLQETEKKLQDLNAILQQSQESVKQLEKNLQGKNEVIAEKTDLLEKKESEIKTMQNNLKDHQQALDDNESFLAKLNDEVKHLTTDLMDAKNKNQENEEHQKDVRLETALAKKISKLREQLLARDELMKELVHSLEETRAQVELEKGDLVMVCNEQKENIKQLQRDLETERNKNAGDRSIDDEVELLKERLQKAVNESLNAKEDVETSSFEKEELQLALDAVNVKVSKLEEELTAEAEMATKEAELLNSLSEVVLKVSSLEEVLQKKDEEIKTLQNEVESRNSLMTTLENENQKAKELFKKLEDEVAKQEKSLADLEELKELKTGLDAENKRVVEQLQSKEKELIKLTLQVERLIQDLYENSKVNEDLKTKLTAAEEKMTSFEEKKESNLGNEETEKMSLSDVKELEKQLKATTIALDKKNSQLIARNNTVNRLKLSLSEKEVKIDELCKGPSTPLSGTPGRDFRTKEEIRTLRRRLVQADKEIEEYKQKAQEHQKKIDEFTAKTGQSHSELNQSLEKAKELEERLSAVEKEYSDAQSKYADLAECLETNKLQLDLYRAQQNVSKEKSMEAEKEMNKLKEQAAKNIEKLNEEAEKLREDLDSKTRELNGMTTKVCDYEKKLKEVETQQFDKMKENEETMITLLERTKNAEASLISNDEKVKSLQESKDLEITQLQALHQTKEKLFSQKGQELDSVKKQFSDTEKEKSEELDKVWKTLVELQEVIKQRGETIDSLEEKLSKAEARHSREKTTLENTVAKMKEVMENKGGDRKKHLAQITELETKLETLTENNKVLIEASENRENDVEEMKKVLEQQDAVMEDQQVALNERQTEIESVVSENTRLQEILSAKDTKGEDTTAEVHRLQATLSVLKQEKMKLEGRLRNAEAKQQEYDSMCQLKDADARTANEEKANMLKAMREALAVAAAKKEEFQTKISEREEELNVEHAKEIEQLKQQYQTATTLKKVAVRLVPVELDITHDKPPLSAPSSKKKERKTRQPTTRARKTEVNRDKNCTSTSNDENIEDTDTDVSRTVTSVTKTKEDMSCVITSVTNSSTKILKDEPIPDDRIEIDVTPIQSRKRASRAAGGSKTKTKKRRSSELPLSEIKIQMSATRFAEQSEDEFTPGTVTRKGTRRTRASSARSSSSSCSSKKQRPPATPLTPMNEEKNQPKEMKNQPSTKRKGFLALFSSSGGSEAEENTPPKSRGRKLLKKDISAPMDSFSPCIHSLNTGTNSSKWDMSKARSIMTRQLRSRVVKM